MLKDFVQSILALKHPEMITHDKRTYVIDGYNPITEPTTGALKVHTLTGITDMIQSNVDIDSYNGQSPVIHIKDYNEVSLISELFGEWKQRDTRMTASSFPHKEINGRWMDVESFIITLNSEFVQNEDRDYLARITSGVTDTGVRDLKDNGITQTAAVKSGISLVDNVEIKNPIILKPFRTFPEIEQPDIQFVFRIRKGNNGPECALFESDGGLWKIQTIQKIKEWFSKKLIDNKDVIIIA